MSADESHIDYVTESSPKESNHINPYIYSDADSEDDPMALKLQVQLQNYLFISEDSPPCKRHSDIGHAFKSENSQDMLNQIRQQLSDNNKDIDIPVRLTAQPEKQLILSHNILV